jgi:hypothetical protein
MALIIDNSTSTVETPENEYALTLAPAGAGNDGVLLIDATSIYLQGVATEDPAGLPTLIQKGDNGKLEIGANNGNVLLTPGGSDNPAVEIGGNGYLRGKDGLLWIGNNGGYVNIGGDQFGVGTKPVLTIASDIELYQSVIKTTADTPDLALVSGTGRLILDGQKFPKAAGTSGQVLTAGTDGNLLWSTPTGGGATTLDGLTDAVIDTPQGGQALVWNGGDSVWENSSLTLDSLFDLSLSGVANNHILKYNSTTQRWTNVPLPASGATNLDGLSDVQIGAYFPLTNGDMLYYTEGDNTWYNGPAPTGSGTVTAVHSGTGLTGGPIQTTGTLSLTGQALALHNLNVSGLIARTTTGIQSRSVAAGTGITVTNGDGNAGNPTIAVATQLQTLNSMSTTGLISRASSSSITPRTITGTTGRVSVTNGDGVSGNPTIDLAASGVSAGTVDVATLTIDTYGRVTSRTGILTTAGDLVIKNASGTTVRLPIGTEGQHLAVASGVPAWVSGVNNPTTATGDILYRNSGGTFSRLGIGTTGQNLTVSGGVPAWAAGVNDPTDGHNQLIYKYNGTFVKVFAPSSYGQVLTYSSTNGISWQAPASGGGGGGAEAYDFGGTPYTTTTASGDQAIAIGANTQAAGQYAVAIGSGYTQANAAEAIAVGANAQANADKAVALGYYAYAAGSYGIAIGKTAKNAGAGITLGHDAWNYNADGLVIGLGKHDNNAASVIRSHKHAFHIASLSGYASDQFMTMPGPNGNSYENGILLNHPTDAGHCFFTGTVKFSAVARWNNSSMHYQGSFKFGGRCQPYNTPVIHYQGATVEDYNTLGGSLTFTIGNNQNNDSNKLGLKVSNPVGDELYVTAWVEFDAVEYYGW